MSLSPASLARRVASLTASAGGLALLLAGCSPDYSPNTYSSNAVQQANKVDKGVIIGMRPVEVAAGGAVGTATGAAAGGALGAQTPGGGVTATLGAIGGGLVGGLIGSTVEHTSNDTKAFEYIVRKTGNELVSVTQKDATALSVGMHVLVIAGPQARIVPDYTLEPEPATATLVPPPSPPPASPPAASTQAASTQAPTTQSSTAAAPAPSVVNAVPLTDPAPSAPVQPSAQPTSVLGQSADPAPPPGPQPPSVPAP
jgi:outer membrane lipoprotein SlyB